MSLFADIEGYPETIEKKKSELKDEDIKKAVGALKKTPSFSGMSVIRTKTPGMFPATHDILRQMEIDMKKAMLTPRSPVFDSRMWTTDDDGNYIEVDPPGSFRKPSKMCSHGKVRTLCRKCK